jgi:hypothetical protein
MNAENLYFLFKRSCMSVWWLLLLLVLMMLMQRQRLNHEEFAQLLRAESRNCYKTVAASKCKTFVFQALASTCRSWSGLLVGSDDLV